MRKLVVDLDGTITAANTDDYTNVAPNIDLIEKLKEYKSMGFTIVINTARNMRTYKGEVGKINIHTVPGIILWLEKHGVPYDEILVGKPWCGTEGFYIDDRAVRPSEFARMSFEDINKMLDSERELLCS